MAWRLYSASAWSGPRWGGPRPSTSGASDSGSSPDRCTAEITAAPKIAFAMSCAIRARSSSKGGAGKRLCR